MNQTTNRVLLLSLIMAAAVFIIFDPLSLITAKPHPPTPQIHEEQATELGKKLKAEALPAQKALLELFLQKQVLLLGDFMFIKEEGEFLAGLVKDLPGAGVAILAVDFLLADDQPAIDALLEATVFDEARARDLLARRNPFLANRQYLAIMRSAWETRQKSQGSTEPFRLLGLNIAWDFAAIQSGQSAGTSPDLKKIFPRGLPDEAMAKTLVDTVLSKGSKALVFTMRDSSISRFDDPSYQQQTSLFDLGNPKRMGRILFDLYPGQIATVFFHGPWQNAASPLTLGYPAGGVVDAALRSLPKDQWPELPFALDLDNGSFGSWTVRDSDYVAPRQLRIMVADPANPGNQIEKTIPAPQAQERQFREFSSLYIVLGAIGSLNPYEAIPDLVTSANLPTVQKFIPLGTPERDSPPALNNMIAQQGQRIREILVQFGW